MYQNKVILAPMVRIGTLPMRLLALDYGADLVYCEEIIDFKILQAKRIENKILGTIDYVTSDATVVFRTCPKEAGRVVFQLGTSDSKRALQAAKKVEKDVAAVDVNMGCPKEFSIKGGMGAALLTKPEKVKEILRTLVQGLSIPVTCKIRILPTIEETLSLARLIESTGVVALAVHGRTRDERSRHANHNDVIRAVAKAINIPVIANGGSKEVQSFEDIKKFQLETGASSVMLARAAEWNCSIFRQAGMLLVEDVIRSYLCYALEFGDSPVNTKYCVLQMLHDTMDSPQGIAMLASKGLEEVCKIWGIEDLYKQTNDHRMERKRKLDNEDSETIAFKHKKMSDGQILTEIPVRYNKNLYEPASSPKQSLHMWCRQNKLINPLYSTTERPEDRCFHSVVTVDGKKYTIPHWEKSKQLAEQGAALACLIVLGVPDGRMSDPGEERENLRKKWLQFNVDLQNGQLDDRDDDRKICTGVDGEGLTNGLISKTLDCDSLCGLGS